MERKRCTAGIFSVILWLALFVVPKIAFAAINIEITDSNGTIVITDNGTTLAANPNHELVDYIKAHTDNSPSGNTLKVTGDAAAPDLSGYTAPSYLTAADTTDSDATNNTVTISGGKLREVYGGRNENGSANDNSVTVKDNATVGSVYGGGLFASNTTDGIVSGNRVTVKDSTVGVVNGGILLRTLGSAEVTGVIEKNTVTIEGDVKTDQYIEGAHGWLSASENGVIIQGNIENTLSMDDRIAGANVYMPNATATENYVTILSGTVKGFQYIFGGDGSGGGEVNQNHVTIRSGTITGATNYGSSPAHLEIYGGYGTSASGNTVEIYGGDFSENHTLSITGGWANNDATGNSVTLTGGTYSDSGTVNIYGGHSGSGNATGNTVTLGAASGGAVLSLPTANIFGGYSVDASKDSFTGNILNIYGQGHVAKNIFNFENINFYLPSNIADYKGDEEKAMLKLTDTSVTDLSGTETIDTKITAYVPGDTELAVGDTVFLVYNPNGMKLERVTSSAVLQAGVSAVNNAKIQLNNDNVSLTVTEEDVPIPTPTPTPSSPSGTKVLPQTKSLVETRATQIALLNESTDLLTSQGIKAAAVSASESEEFEPFFAMEGSKYRYETGSHVDLRAFHLNGGFARGVKNEKGRLLFGAVIEYGKGSYESYIPGVHASGETSYVGGGILARQENDDGVYYEGSFRAGNAKADYESRDLVGADRVSYDISSPYLAFHAGLGKVFSIGGGNTLDVYGRYSYHHQYGDDVTLQSGERYRFRDVDSHRLRVGGRLTHAFDERNKAYIHFAYEYEFAGEAKADMTILGTRLTTPAPSLKGSKGILDIGYEWKPSNDMTLDLSFGGSVGMSKGFHGTLNISLDL